MPDDESSIFGNLPGRSSDDDEAVKRRARTRLYMRMRGPEEGPLPPSPWRRGVGGPSINQTPVVAGSTWSAADASANSMTLSNGGMAVTAANTSAWQSIRGTNSKTSGKLYVEFLATGAPLSGNTQMLGLASAGFVATSYLGNSNYSGGDLLDFAGNFVSPGFTSNYATAATLVASGDVWALAVDFSVGSLWIARNNVWFNSSNPATGSLPVMSFVQATVGALFPTLSLQKPTDGVWTLQPTAASQKYAPPAGFSPWG